MRVRFLRAKRYPHPDGLKRTVGEIVEVEDHLGVAWACMGLVEPVADPGAPEVVCKPAEALTASPAKPKARKKGR